MRKLGSQRSPDTGTIRETVTVWTPLGAKRDLLSRSSRLDAISPSPTIFQHDVHVFVSLKSGSIHCSRVLMNKKCTHTVRVQRRKIKDPSWIRLSTYLVEFKIFKGTYLEAWILRACALRCSLRLSTSSLSHPAPHCTPPARYFLTGTRLLLQILFCVRYFRFQRFQHGG